MAYQNEVEHAGVRTPEAAGVILVVEDDPDIAGHVAARLAGAGYHPIVSHDGGDAFAVATGERRFDAIVLDRKLPTLDGLQLMRALRARQIDAPVLMLTALDGVRDRVEGLNAGADDYLVKPFAAEEMLARVAALIRRRRQDAGQTELRLGTLTLDLVRHAAWRDGEPLLLQPREFRLLEVLAQHAGSILSRSMLLERVWNYSFDPRTKVLETHLSRLRAKLNAGGRPDLIETIRGAGYRMLLP